jgi:hypothetical protein
MFPYPYIITAIGISISFCFYLVCFKTPSNQLQISAMGVWIFIATAIIPGMSYSAISTVVYISRPLLRNDVRVVDNL